jgi:hypothetical protein
MDTLPKATLVWRGVPMKTLRPHSLALLAMLLLGTWMAAADAAPPSQPADRTESMSASFRARRPVIADRVVRSNLRIRLGDEARWARPDWDDHDWERLGSMFDSPMHQGIFWLRFRVRSPDPADRVPTGAWIMGLMAYEMYWDGVLITRNGAPAYRAEEEVPGRMDVLSIIPEAMTGPGEHVVAMRISSYRDRFPGDKSWFLFFMEEPTTILRWEMQNGIYPTLAAGAMFILAAVCALGWYFGGRHTPLLCVGAMCLGAAMAQALTALRWFYNYPTDWHYPLTMASAACYGVVAWCLVAFVFTNFAVPWRRRVLLGLLPLFTLLCGLTPEARGVWVTLTAFGVAIGPLTWLTWHRRLGAWPVLAGVIVSAGWLLANPWLYAWTGFLFRFSPVLIGVAVAIALWVRLERREAQQTRLMATRLEIELLKKTLQPHFLMNTLTALMEVIEQNPSLAIKLIDDLAGEFRLLAAMSAEKTVSLAQELELCRTHLRVMSVRIGRECGLELEGMDESAYRAARVPPALFLTLIENGFSHQSLVSSPAVFKLHGFVSPGGAVRYTFVSPGEVRGDSRTPGGTGLRYIRARLEESSPGRWAFDGQATAQGWESVITIGWPATVPVA